MEHARTLAPTVAKRSANVNRNRADDAIDYLHHQGAQFVLCDGKRPVQGQAFKSYHPTLEIVRNHHANGGNLGIVPATIGTSALDLDYGDPADLLHHHPARAVVPTMRPGGLHIYYDHDPNAEQREWDKYGCGGEVRSKPGGYVVEYSPESWQTIADSIARPGSFPFPADLWAAVGDTLPTQYAPLDGGALPQPVADYVPPSLENIAIGHRHDALYDAVRHKAYQHAPGPDSAAWRARVIAYAQANNRRFRVPLLAPEVVNIGVQVARHTWDNRDKHKPGAGFTTEQRSRGGKRRSAMVRAANYERDCGIRADHLAHMSYTEIAANYGCSIGTVQNVLRRMWSGGII